MASSPYADDLRLAHVLADQVERITMSRFQADDLVVESKPDLTPVTDADRAAAAELAAIDDGAFSTTLSQERLDLLEAAGVSHETAAKHLPPLERC